MEAAYTELYQEFLRLRSLCLKQAALLQQLTEDLQRQRGVSVPEGGLGDIPVQWTLERPGPPTGRPGDQQALALNHATHRGVLGPLEAAGTFSELLARDMGRLQLDRPYAGVERKEVLKPPAFGPLDPPSYNDPMAPSHFPRMPRVCGSYLDSEFLSQPGGMMLSEPALQSQVCEFCHAVFPGHITTKGEFLRHLHTHIT